MKDALIQLTVYVIEPGREIVFAEKGMPSNQKMIDAVNADRR